MIASGGADNLIRLMDIQAQRIDGVLIGHQKNVCTLASYQQRILSGSWDGTARVWEGGHLLWTLKGHENAVWCVLFLDDETFLTGTLQPQSPAREISVCCVGSADKTIKLWKQDQCLKTFTGHSDCIRSLQLLDLNRGTFASTSNDGTIRLWSIEDDQIGTIDSAHDSFIYTLAKIDANHVASAGEDRCIKIWDLKAKQCLQSIPIPAVSIWCLCCLDEYTLACGTNDGNVYMFSSDPLRQLQDEALLQLFQERLGSNTISKASMSSSIDASKVQGVESLSRPGKKPGENRMVNNNGKVEVYQWDSAEWIKIGDVVDSAGSSVKQEYAGQEYDYVFDVQVEDGGPSLKLPYNLSGTRLLDPQYNSCYSFALK